MRLWWKPSYLSRNKMVLCSLSVDVGDIEMKGGGVGDCKVLLPWNRSAWFIRCAASARSVLYYVHEQRLGSDWGSLCDTEICTPEEATRPLLRAKTSHSLLRNDAVSPRQVRTGSLAHNWYRWSPYYRTMSRMIYVMVICVYECSTMHHFSRHVENITAVELTIDGQEMLRRNPILDVKWKQKIFSACYI